MCYVIPKYGVYKWDLPPIKRPLRITTGTDTGTDTDNGGDSDSVGNDDKDRGESESAQKGKMKKKGSNYGGNNGNGIPPGYGKHEEVRVELLLLLIA